MGEMPAKESRKEQSEKYMTTQNHVVSGSGSKCFERREGSPTSLAAKRVSKGRTENWSLDLARWRARPWQELFSCRGVE